MMKFTLDGDPVAHRYEIVQKGKHSSLKKTKKYAAWSEGLGWQVRNIKNRLGLVQFKKGTPLGISFTFRFTRPKTVKRKYPTTPPDLNNIIKPIEDACKGVFLHDDKDIVEYGRTRKLYCEPGEPAGITVTLWEIKD
jgi:Holliday junction resolvase RusA-like endonuclease